MLGGDIPTLIDGRRPRAAMKAPKRKRLCRSWDVARSILTCDSRGYVVSVWERLYMALTERRKGRCSPKPNRRRALELLASCPEGCTEAILAARDIPVSLIVQLVRAGLATTKAERVVAGRLTIEVTKIG